MAVRSSHARRRAGPPPPAAAEGRLELTLRCGDVAAGGGCVARDGEGRVVFVRHALPGELVRAAVTQENTSFLRADAVEVIEASPDRVEPPCPHAGPGRCGGCDYQHVRLPAQRELKARRVEEALRRIAGIERSVTVEPLRDDDGLRWRTRVRFAVDDRGRTGFHRYRSNEIEPVDFCPLATPAVDALGLSRSRWAGCASLEAVATGADAVVIASPPRGARLDATGLLAQLADGTGALAGREVLRRPSRLRTTVQGLAYEFHATSFWQVHEDAPAALVSAVLDALELRGGERVLDAYAGAGLFSLPIARAVGPAGRVVAVERSRRACEDARHNLREAPNAVVREAALAARLIAAEGPFDAIVLDPPREGVERGALHAIAALEPAPRLVYVACDPASFARDLDILGRARWELVALHALDLFPMTEHVETIALFAPERGGTGG